jgi:hypothetical protein
MVIPGITSGQPAFSKAIRAMFAALVSLTHNDFIHLIRLQVGPFDGFFEYQAGKIIGFDIFESAHISADRRPHGTDDDGLVHLNPPKFGLNRTE